MEFSKRLSTDRLLLRPLSARDFWFFCRLVGNRDVRRYLGGPIPWRHRYPRFASYRRGAPGTAVWAVQVRQGSRAIGLVELGPHKGGTDHEISHQFHPKFWGRGFAKEAASAVMIHALADMGLPRIFAETQQANEASCRLLKSPGMAEQMPMAASPRIGVDCLSGD